MKLFFCHKIGCNFDKMRCTMKSMPCASVNQNMYFVKHNKNFFIFIFCNYFQTIRSTTAWLSTAPPRSTRPSPTPPSRTSRGKSPSLKHSFELPISIFFKYNAVYKVCNRCEIQCYMYLLYIVRSSPSSFEEKKV